MTQETAPTVPLATAPEVSMDASQPGQVRPTALQQQAAPEEAPESINPLLDRSEPQNLTDAHLEGASEDEPVETQDTPEDSTEQEAPATLADMVGSELMQDPGCSLVARGLERLCTDKVDHNRAFGNAIENDDARFIDEAYLREVLGDDAEEAIASAKYLLDYAGTYAEKLQQTLYESVPGGEAAVQLAAKHFNSTATAEDKRLVATLLDSGNMEYMQHAIRLITDRAKGVMPQHTAQTFGTPTALQPLSRAEFGKAVLDNPSMTPAEYEKLRARLAAGLR